MPGPLRRRGIVNLLDQGNVFDRTVSRNLADNTVRYWIFVWILVREVAGVRSSVGDDFLNKSVRIHVRYANKKDSGNSKEWKCKHFKCLKEWGAEGRTGGNERSGLQAEREKSLMITYCSHSRLYVERNNISE